MKLIILLGLTAAILTTLSSLPQVVKVIKTKRTKDLSLGMYTLLTTGIFLWFLYGIFLNNLPIILANGATLIFTTVILFFIIKNK